MLTDGESDRLLLGLLLMLTLTEDETESLTLDDALLLMLELTELDAELLAESETDDEALPTETSTGPVTG
jgi:hypothetical protein